MSEKPPKDKEPYPVMLDISGICVRHERDGAWGSYDILDLTENELTRALSGRTSEELIRWVYRVGLQFRKFYCEIRENLS